MAWQAIENEFARSSSQNLATMIVDLNGIKIKSKEEFEKKSEQLVRIQNLVN